MPKYLVNIHTCGGSMGEAVWPQWSATVSSKEEADKLESKIYAAFRGTWQEDDVVVVQCEVEDGESVEDAIARLKADKYWFDEEDEDEAELNRKVDGMMHGETAALNDLFKDTYHKPRQTVIVQPADFTRYPVGPDPYADAYAALDGDDPFGDMTDEELGALSDEEFSAILRKHRDRGES